MAPSIRHTVRWLLLALLAACGAAAPADSAPRPQTYTIAYFLQPEAPAVTVMAMIPGSWAATLEADGAPAFTVPGHSGFFKPTIVALASNQPDSAARLEQAMELQYGEGTPDVVRTPLADGRIWAVRQEPAVIHARMFIPAPHGVVMAVALVKHAEADRLAEIEAVYRTVRVQPPAAPPSP